MTTTLRAVAGHLPDTAVDVPGYLRECGLTEDRARLYQHYFGFSEIRLAPEATLAQQLTAAAAGLADLDRVRYVIQARTMPVVALYPANPLAEVCASLGLRHAQAFTLTQHACASALVAVDLAGRLLADDPDALALVLTGEKAYMSRFLTDTSVMGEGAVAILVQHGGEHDEVLGFARRTYGEFHAGSLMPVEYNESYKNLYPVALADVMREAVDRAGLDVDDIALVLPHNVNRMSWVRVLKKLGITGSGRLFLDNLPVFGHCFGADCFLNYRTAVDQGRLRPGDHYMMTSVGINSTFAAMVLRH